MSRKTPNQAARFACFSLDSGDLVSATEHADPLGLRYTWGQGTDDLIALPDAGGPTTSSPCPTPLATTTTWSRTSSA